jgi:hypothetical protein
MEFQANSSGEALAYAHTGRRRGGPRSGRGWSISAIARHLGRDRATVRGYLAGDRVPGVRKRVAPDPLEPFVTYLAARFVDDAHLWLTALYDEVVPLGYPRSYPSFARGVRRLGLRPLTALPRRDGQGDDRDRASAGRRGSMWLSA